MAENGPFSSAVRRMVASTVSRRAAIRGGVGVAATFGLASWRVGAQEATQEPSGPVSAVAHRLTNPRGFTWDSAGSLDVALAGSGGAGILGPDSGGG